MLARHFALMRVNIQANPESYSPEVRELVKVFNQLDDLIHLDAKWCTDLNCPYLKRKQLRDHPEDKVIKQISNETDQKGN